MCMCACTCVVVVVGKVRRNSSGGFMCLCLCVLSLLVCCLLFSEVKFLDMLEDELPQNHLPRMLSLITNEG